MPAFNITRAAHIEYRVTDLDRARAFYVEALGFVETARDRDRIYLGGLEERDLYSLTLRKAESPGVTHLAFRVAAPEDLDRLAELYAAQGCPIRWLEPEAEEAGQGRALRVQDVSGLPLEFFCQMHQRPWLLQRFDQYRGAMPMRLDHFNCQVPDVEAAAGWWQERLGFWCSEYTVTEAEPPRLWASWLHRKQNVHDIALMTGTGPRLHHTGFWVADTLSVLRACDILAALGMGGAIERGPGRHGISNAFFLYLRDPDGNRIELYTGDYLIPDPDWKPVRWTVNDPRRATFWGHIPPRSWFEEAALVGNVVTGQFMPTEPPKLTDRPEFAT